MWCARRHRPFSIVSDPELQELFKMLYSRVTVPHPTTVSRDVTEMYILSKERVAKMLKVSAAHTFLPISYTHQNRRITLVVCTLAWMGGHPPTFIRFSASLFIASSMRGSNHFYLTIFGESLLHSFMVDLTLCQNDKRTHRYLSCK